MKYLKSYENFEYIYSFKGYDISGEIIPYLWKNRSGKKKNKIRFKNKKQKEEHAKIQ
jgi:hypothetical protein